jgi:hypothetical protein
LHFWLKAVCAWHAAAAGIALLLQNAHLLGILLNHALLPATVLIQHTFSVWLQGLWLASAECQRDQNSGGVRPLPVQEHTLLVH